MANKAADKFLSYLKDYGPYVSSNAQYDEHVRNSARLNGIRPFLFEMPRQNSYRDQIAACVQQGRSQIFILNGQAGDGKTHFMRRLCTDAQLFGLTPDTWDLSISGVWRVLPVDAQGNALTTPCVTSDNFELTDSSVSAAVKRSSDDRTFRACTIIIPAGQNRPRPVRLVTVSDLSTVESKEDMALIVSTLETCAREYGAAPAAGAGASADRAAGADGAGDCITIGLIAGNNGRILKLFQDCESYIRSRDAGLRQSLSTLAADMEKHMLTRRVFSCDFLTLLTMTDCLDRQAVRNIFLSVLDHEGWEKCEGCEACSKCAVYSNRRVLRTDRIINKFCDVFELARDNGINFTVRNILMIVANGVVGNSDSKRYYSCTKALNDALGRNKKELSDRRTSPFDNLLGRNMTKTRRQEAEDELAIYDNSATELPVFKLLELFAVGKTGCRTADSFILKGNLPGSPAAAAHRALITSCDEVGMLKKLNDCIDEIRDHINSDGSSAATLTQQRTMHGCMQALRRQLFFVMPEAPNALFNEWDMTAISYGSAYLKTKQLLRTTFNLDDESIAPSVGQLINGLNRAFTSLPVINSDKKVFITSNNRINPAAYSVLPDFNRYQIPFDGSPENFSNVIKLVHSGLVKDSRAIPALVYYRSSAAARQNTDASDPRNEAILKAFNASSRLQQHLKEDMENNPEYYDDALNGDRNNAPLIRQIEAWIRSLEALKKLRRLSADALLDYEELSELMLKAGQNSSSVIASDLISYPENVTSSGREPDAAAWLILTPRLFNYLMALGSGQSAVSFTPECADEVSLFKDRIDYLITTAAQTSSDQSASSDRKLRLGNLRFCNLDTQGRITN